MELHQYGKIGIAVWSRVTAALEHANPVVNYLLENRSSKGAYFRRLRAGKIAIKYRVHETPPHYAVLNKSSSECVKLRARPSRIEFSCA